MLLVSLAACDQSQPVKRTDVPVAVSSTGFPEPTSPPAPPTRPVTTPTATTGVSAPALVPAAGKGEKGARNVLLEWARAIERRDFARADAQWGDGAGEAKSAARFADFASLTIGVGNGAVEGGAGSLYYEVPLTVTGKRKDGTAVSHKGSVVLRRVNDVDGATPAQLRWHIASVTLGP